jgi:hypothetical protein
MNRHWSRFAVLALPTLALFTACGGGQSVAASKQPTVLGTQNFNVAAGDGVALSIDVPNGGALAATANWTTAGQVDVYITDSTCASLDDLVLGSCRVLARAAVPACCDNLTHASLQTVTAFGVQPGRYQAFVLAAGPDAGSGTVQFVLSP